MIVIGLVMDIMIITNICLIGMNVMMACMMACNMKLVDNRYTYNIACNNQRNGYIYDFMIR
jgi:hypothetical protein